MRQWPAEKQYPALDIPETWKSVQDFADWYFESGKPMLVPWDAEIVQVDNSSSVTLFRQGAFQVELYIIHAGWGVPTHAHPGVDVVTVRLGGGGSCGGPHPKFNTGLETGQFVLTPAGQKHTFPAQAGGFVLLSFEHWKTGVPSSAAKRWQGSDIGPIHKILREQQP